MKGNYKVCMKGETDNIEIWKPLHIYARGKVISFLWVISFIEQILWWG